MQMGNRKETGQSKNANLRTVYPCFQEDVDQTHSVNEFFQAWGDNDVFDCKQIESVTRHHKTSKSLVNLTREENAIEQQNACNLSESLEVDAHAKPLQDANRRPLIQVSYVNQEQECKETQCADTLYSHSHLIVFN